MPTVRLFPLRVGVSDRIHLPDCVAMLVVLVLFCEVSCASFYGRVCGCVVVMFVWVDCEVAFVASG